jgi:hypothetical protein
MLRVEDGASGGGNVKKRRSPGGLGRESGGLNWLAQIGTRGDVSGVVESRRNRELEVIVNAASRTKLWCFGVQAWESQLFLRGSNLRSGRESQIHPSRVWLFAQKAPGGGRLLSTLWWTVQGLQGTR